MKKSVDIKKQQAIIIDVLSARSLFELFLKFGGIRDVYYQHMADSWVTGIALYIAKASGRSFRQIEYSSSPIEGSSPFLLLNSSLIGLVRASREEIFLGVIDGIKGMSYYERTRLAAAFGKYASRELYHTVQLYVFIKTQCLFKDDIAAALIRSTIFNGIIEGLFRNGGLRAVFYRSPGSARIVPRDGYMWDKIMAKYNLFLWRRLARTLSLAVYSMWCRVILLLRGGKPEIKRRRICALIAGTNATDIGNNVSWSMPEKDTLEQETLALHLPAMPEKARSFYSKRFGKFIEYSFSPFAGNRDPELTASWAVFLKKLFRNIKRYRPLFRMDDLGKWMSGYLIDIITYMSFFESLFAVNGTRIVWASDLDDSQTQTAAIAINRLGGLSMGTTLSHGGFPEWSVQNNKNDVTFAWGERFVRIRKGSHDQTDSYVIVGYPMDRVFIDESRKSKDLRNELRERHGARNVIAFYDSRSGRENIVSSETQQGIYREFFSWLEADSGNFLLVKAKRSDTVREYQWIKERIDELSAAGRLRVIYDKSAISPGLAADVVVSATPTPAILMAALGHNLIFYNTHEIDPSYSMTFPGVRLVGSITELSGAIRNFFSAAPSNPVVRHGPGGWKGTEIDPFMDGKAASRMRGYLGNLILAFDKGLNVAEAIDLANRRHAEEWGGGMVLAGPLTVKSGFIT